MRIDMRRLRLQDLAPGWQVYFPHGLLGFPQRQMYCIQYPLQEAPFRWLQAMDDPPLAFVLVDPFLFLPDYQLEVSAQDLQELGGVDPDALVVCTIVTLPREASPCLSVNLQGPVLMNGMNGWAKQLVLMDSPYHTCHPLVVTQHAPSVSR